MPGNPRINLFINQHNVENSVLVQIQDQKHTVKLSEILKNATEEQCFGRFMKISESTDRNEDRQTTSMAKSTVRVCVNGLLMSKARIGDVSSPVSIYEYIADDGHHASFKEIGSYLETLGL
jgi:hypothetical protein